MNKAQTKRWPIKLIANDDASVILVMHTLLTNTLIEQLILLFGLASVQITGVQINKDPLYCPEYNF